LLPQEKKTDPGKPTERDLVVRVGNKEELIIESLESEAVNSEGKPEDEEDRDEDLKDNDAPRKVVISEMWKNDPCPSFFTSLMIPTKK
jgi:hypothetical protein